MTSSQKSLYFREFGAARRACLEAGAPDPDRHALHVRALGTDVSSRALTNRQLDAVLAVFRAISAGDNLNAQLRQQIQPRIRLLWKIQNQLCMQLAVVLQPPPNPAPATWSISLDTLPRAEKYILSIIEDKYPTDDPDDPFADLTEDQLRRLTVDLTRCINIRRASIGLDWPTIRALATRPCVPSVPSVPSDQSDPSDCPF